MLHLSGPVDAPSCTLSVRAGWSDWERFRDGTVHQRCRAIQPAIKLREAAFTLRDRLTQRLATFTEMRAWVDGHVLVRRRQVAAAAEEQRFEGFWGRLRVPGAPDSVFGSDPQGQMVFRRGLWEDWDYGVAGIEQVDRSLPVIFSPYCATLLHEAVGHAMEAEYLSGSPLKYMVGDCLTKAPLTVMDRPDLPGYPGSMTYDDTGAPVTQTTMIHRGFLVGDLDHGKGVLRRGSFREMPMIRASNFVIHRGKDDPASWVQDLPECYYVTEIQSGNWRPGNTKFKILSGPLFRLQRGEVTGYRDWAVFNFTTLNILARIDAIGRDLRMDPVVHWCVKRNQPIPMGMGAPSLLVRGETR